MVLPPERRRQAPLPWEKDDDWGYGVSRPERQAKLGVYTDALQRLTKTKLTAGGVIARFHQRRVLPLLHRRPVLDEMVLGAKPGGTQMAEKPLANDVAIQRVKSTMNKLLLEPFTVAMRPEAGYLQFVSAPFRFPLSR